MRINLAADTEICADDQMGIAVRRVLRVSVESESCDRHYRASFVDARNLIRVGAPLMLANDGTLFAPETRADPVLGKAWGGVPEGDNLMSLDTENVFGLRAAEKEGYEHIRVLRAYPERAILTRGMEAPAAEEASYKAVVCSGEESSLHLDAFSGWRKSPARDGKNYRRY